MWLPLSGVNCIWRSSLAWTIEDVVLQKVKVTFCSNCFLFARVLAFPSRTSSSSSKFYETKFGWQRKMKKSSVTSQLGVVPQIYNPNNQNIEAGGVPQLQV